MPPGLARILPWQDAQTPTTMGSVYSKLKSDYGRSHGLDYTNGSGSTVSGGAVVQVGGKIGMVFDDVLDTEQTVIVIAAEDIVWPKATGFATVIGYPVHHNVLLGSASSSPGDPIIGHYNEVVASGATEVRIALSNEQNIIADGGAIFYADTQLTAANLLALAATNIEVVPAPDAGFAIVPVGAHMFLDHGGTDFVQTNATDAIAIRYSASTECSELGTEAQMTALLEASADAPLYVNIEADFVPVAATALDLDNNGAAEWTTGDGTLSIRVFYRIVPMVAFT